MAKMYPLLDSFAAGEISPRLFSRAATQAYRNGVSVLENFITTTHGPVVRRGGLKFVQREPSDNVRLMTYKHNRETAFVLMFLDGGRLLIYDVSFGIEPTFIVELVHPYADDKLSELQYDAPPNATELIVVGGGIQMRQIQYDASNPTPALRWTIGSYSTSGTPSEWSGSNWPRCITYYQGRLWLGSTDNQPERVWASKSGNFNNFTQGALDDDGLEYTVSEKGRIEWMAGVRTLLIGTANGEHIATDSNGGPGVLTPSELDINQQSAFGSRAMQPVKVGNLILYAAPDGKKIRDIGYKWEEDGWLSRDITFISEHMPKLAPIIRMCFSQHPENHLWSATSLGTLICGTYELATDEITAETVGWHRHVTNGTFKEVVNVDVSGTSKLYVATVRTLPADVTDHVYLEEYSEDVFMDSYVYQDLGGGKAVTGLTHLAGMTVRPLVDGAVLPEITLDSSGDGTLLYAGNDAYIGLGFTSKLKTLPLDQQMPNERGSSASHMKRWNKIYVRILDSAKPIINGIRPATRYPGTPMDTAEPFLSENIEVGNFGWDRYAQVEVEQDLPVPLTITGIFGEIAQESL